jgi:hypothetical protein
MRVARLEKRAGQYKNILIDVVDSYEAELTRALGVSDLGESPLYDDIMSGDLVSAIEKCPSSRGQKVLLLMLDRLINMTSMPATKAGIASLSDKVLFSSTPMRSVDVSSLVSDTKEMSALDTWNSLGLLVAGKYLTEVGQSYILEISKP